MRIRGGDGCSIVDRFDRRVLRRTVLGFGRFDALAALAKLCQDLLTPTVDFWVRVRCQFRTEFDGWLELLTGIMGLHEDRAGGDLLLTSGKFLLAQGS
ncbi:MAG: hypothetical protein J7641_02700 [Cyanobacteria bacterium SID2]|nr:hypothetical protein [Cyanobacteria bacterium SID2]MBP0003847.1 hypothetical protein [Cyanobacteria bacterium SBC]